MTLKKEYNITDKPLITSSLFAIYYRKTDYNIESKVQTSKANNKRQEEVICSITNKCKKNNSAKLQISRNRTVKNCWRLCHVLQHKVFSTSKGLLRGYQRENHTVCYLTIATKKGFVLRWRLMETTFVRSMQAYSILINILRTG
jgi:hypothetical protein